MPDFFLDVSRAAPGNDLKDVTPDDDNDLPDGPCRALRIGDGGDVAVITNAGTAVTIPNCQDGSTEPHGVRRVLATGTTATRIQAVY